MNTTVEAARTQMVNQQVRTWHVLDPAVLQVLAAVPRERFVPARYRGQAFADTEIPLACGQVMMSPQVEGRVLQSLQIRATDNVLEVGTGSGFLTACLARLAGKVTSIELFPELAEGARARLRETGAGNTELATGDAFQMAPTQKYDAIAITGSLPRYDPRFQDWLAVGGRLLIIVGEAPLMEACLIRRVGPAEWSTESLFETVVPPLLNAAQPARFVF